MVHVGHSQQLPPLKAIISLNLVNCFHFLSNNSLIVSLFLTVVQEVGNYGPCNISKKILKILSLTINTEVEMKLVLISNTMAKLKSNP